VFFFLLLLTESDRAKLLVYAEDIIKGVDGGDLLDDLQIMDVIDYDEYIQLVGLHDDRGNEGVMLALLDMMKEKDDDQVEHFVSEIINQQPSFGQILTSPLPHGEYTSSLTLTCRQLRLKDNIVTLHGGFDY